MEVASHLWLEDGRLLILAVGLCRFKVCYQHAFRKSQDHELDCSLNALLRLYTSLTISLPRRERCRHA